MSFDFIFPAGFVPRTRCADSAGSARPHPADQALVPGALYSHPVAVLNIGDSPAAGSVRVPLKLLVGVIVPRSSIPDALPDPELKMRSVDPLFRLIVPLSGKTTVVGGFCQKLVELLSVPSARTSRCAVISEPSASPPLQGSVLVFVTVKDQLPAASAWVMTPPPEPPMPKRPGSVLVSQAAVRTSRVRARAIGRT